MIKPKGSMRARKSRPGFRQQTRQHSPTVERRYRKQIKNHQKYVDLYARFAR